ncbi:MAG TPA: hypothetical protein VMV33_01060, partial [Rhodocyclaceae bacterium]|nr:hypothetical protein [Rhodocyclaceae bacterium]
MSVRVMGCTPPWEHALALAGRGSVHDIDHTVLRQRLKRNVVEIGLPLIQGRSSAGSRIRARLGAWDRNGLRALCTRSVIG